MKLLGMWVLGLGCLAGAPTAVTDEAATARQVANLHAFARLYGLVRYWHPSDEAAALDWDRFVVYGAGQVVDAADDAALQARLETLFRPLAPTMVLYRTGEAAPDPAQPLPADTNDLVPVFWRHMGVGVSPDSLYRSHRAHRDNPLPKGQAFGNLMTLVSAKEQRGHTLRFSLSARVLNGSAMGWVRVDREGGHGFFDNMMDRPIVSGDWQRYTIEGPVADDATQIAFGVLVNDPDVHVRFDDLTLETRNGDGPWTPIPLTNADFQDADLGDWMERGDGFTFAAVPRADAADNLCLDISPSDRPEMAEAPFDAAPAPGTFCDKALNNALSVKLLQHLYSDARHTLGSGDPDALKHLVDAAAALPKPADMDPTRQDVRLGAVVHAWNIFRHFYPYWDVVAGDWDAVLDTALREALPDADMAGFEPVLQKMVAALHDGHGRVVHAKLEADRAGLAVALQWIGDQAVVVRSEDERFQPGDAVTAVDGVPTATRMADLNAHLSGSPQWRAYRAMGLLLRGKKDSEAQITLDRNGTSLTVTAPRTNTSHVRTRAYAPIEKLEDGIYYVDLDQAPMDQIEKEIEALAAAPGVVFDMRGYPKGNHPVLGYLTDTDVKSPDWQIPCFTRPDTEGVVFKESGWPVPARKPRFAGKAVFLIDGRAISYAETFMSMVDHFKLGAIVGSPTAGANGNINPFIGPGGYRYMWTGMKVIRHDGGRHHLVGIQPTHPLEPTRAGITAGRDELREKAVSLIKGE